MNKRFLLMCQNCNKQYEKIKDFKMHCRSFSHKQEVSKLFQTAMHHGPVYFPIFLVLDHLINPPPTDPLIGLDMVTLFITPEKLGAFYLCHVCEKQLNSDDVMFHLCSVKHYFKYLSFRNPDLLRFAWMNDSLSYLKTSAMQERCRKGSGNLRIFSLPKMMLKRGKKLTYNQVMSMFSKTDKILERMKAGMPQMKTIQQYITDPGRVNPLIGLNSMIKYSCPDNEGCCGYLCLLCKMKIPAFDCVSHCLSFDHVYTNLKAFCPASLQFKSSHYSYSFHKKILNLANQAQTDCPSMEIQCVQLDLETFKNVDSLKYLAVLNKLQLIQRERNESELNTNAKPGEQILCAPVVNEASVSSSAVDISTENREEMTQKDTKIQRRDDQPCKILCVECDQTFTYISDYKKHIDENLHLQKHAELFGQGPHKGLISEIKLYQYMWSRQEKTSPPPIIGLQLFTVFVQRESQGFNSPIYVCHACERNIPVSNASTHLASTQHYFNVFAYTKPDCVFTGSHNQITAFAREEEKLQGKEKIVLRVCELPSEHFREFRSLAYEKIMAKCATHNAKLHKCIKVEERVTLQLFSKCCNRKCPLLGLQFILKYSTTKPYFKGGYLCLLCEKKLPERLAIVHVLSFPHMLAYFNLAHPGSLSREDAENTPLIMDLAQKAESYSPNVDIQEIQLSFCKFNAVERSSFKDALDFLHSVFREKGIEEIKPSVIPGLRLVSSFKKDCQEDSQCEKQDGSSPLLDKEQVTFDRALTERDNMDIDCPYLTHPKQSEPLDTTLPVLAHVQTASSVVQILDNFTLTPLPSLLTQQSEPMEDSPVSFNQTVATHKKSTEVFPAVEHHLQDSYLTQQQHVELSHKTVTLENVLPELKFYDLKTENQVSETPSACSKLWGYLKTINREPVIGLKAILECHTDGQPPFYVCVTCAEKFDENSIISHLTCQDHQLMYLKSIKYAPLKYKKRVKAKWLKAQAILVEKHQGYGEAEVIELDAEDYHEIFSAPIITALGILRDSLLKLTSEIKAGSPVAASSNNFKTDESPGPEESIEQQDQNNKRLIPTNQRSKIKKINAVIGLNFVTCVTHGKKKLFFCELCSVRCHVDHMASMTHRKTYLEQKYPGWTASGINIEKKLNKMALRLAAVERSTGMRMKKLSVTAKVFTVLRIAPLSEALSQLTLLNKGLEAGVDQTAVADCLEPNSYNTLDHKHDEITDSPSITQGYCLTPLLDSCSFPCVPHSSLPSESNVSPSKDLVPPPRPYSPISPPPPFLYSTVSPTLPLLCTIPNTPSLSSQPGTQAKCLSPPSTPYEPTCSPLASSCQQSTHIYILSSSTPPTAGIFSNYTGEESASVCNQSMVTESKINTALFYKHTFPNLPAVMGQSFVSGFLSVKGLQSTVPIIGLPDILECRKMKLATFYLCLNCAESVGKLDICNHMTSESHQNITIRTQYPERFQYYQGLISVCDMARIIASLEKGLDAKVVKLDQLDQEQYDALCSASFYDAINVLQSMYGPEESKNDQRNKEKSTPQSVPDSVMTEKEAERFHAVVTPAQHSCDNTPQQKSPSSQRHRDCSSMHQSQSSAKTLPESGLQAQQNQHDYITQTCLTVESDKSTGLQSSKPYTQKTSENPGRADQSGSTTQNELQILASTTQELQEGTPAQMLPCSITIKQEKLNDEVIGMTIPFGAPSPKEATGNTFKRTNDLKEYVSNKRAAPEAVVGLSSVIECRSEGQFLLYLCVSCSSKLNHDLIIDHLLKCGHRYSYLRARYPSYFEDWSESDSRSQQSMRLMWFSHKVETMYEDEPGQLQKMKLKCEDLKDVKAMSYDKAITHLQEIRRKQKLCALQTCILPKTTTDLIKQERMDIDVMQHSPHLGNFPESYVFHVPRQAAKRKALETDSSHECLSKKKSSGDSASHVKESKYTDPNHFEPQTKRNRNSVNNSDSVSQQKRLSFLTVTHSDPVSCCMSVIVPETSSSSSENLEPSSQICKKTISLAETVAENKILSSHMVTAKQNDTCAKTNTISVLPSVEGREIVRLSEKRQLVKKRSNENAWNYENRQFCSDLHTIKTNIMAETCSEIVDKKEQNIAYSLQSDKKEPIPYFDWKGPVNCLDTSAYACLDRTAEPSLPAKDNAHSTSYPVMTHNRNANWNLSMASGYTTNTVTSQFPPTVPQQYFIFNQPALPQTAGTLCTVAPSFVVPVGQKVTNFETAAPGISMNGSYLTNSSYTSQTDGQLSQVYQPTQSFQDPEAYHNYYARYTYSQSGPQAQTASANESVTPTASTHGHKDGLYPLSRWPQN